MSNIGNNKRIAKNTAFLYFRMLLIMLVTLYTSRIVLAELGVVDFGLYNVVAGVVAMLGFLKSAMSLSVQRFLSYEIGCKNENSLNIIFNVAILAHFILGIIVVIVAETLGYWIVSTQLVIPSDRLSAAIIVFHTIVVTSFFSILEVPFNAVLISAERFNVYAYISIIEVLLKLLISYLLIIVCLDKLVVYALLVMVVHLFISLAYILYTKKKFTYTQFRFVWNLNVVKKILGFSVWSLLGELSWALVLQGINILINIFCGPLINAARAISYQVSGALQNLSRSFLQALNPQLIKLYASGQVLEMTNLLYRGTRFSYFLLLFFTCPLFLEIDFILEVWLDSVPQHTALFCQLVLIGNLVDSLSILLATVVKAYGKIRNYQIIISLILMFNFPLSYIFLKIGFFPQITICIYILISVLLLFVRLFFTRRMVRLSIKGYILGVIYPIIKVTIIVSLVLYFIHSLQEPSVIRFFLSVVSSVLVVLSVTYMVGLTKKERCILYNFIISKVHK